MTVRQVLPPGLAEMVPGPELGVLLAGIDIHVLTGFDAVEVLRARARQLSHEQARLLATMVEVGLCDPDATGDEVARLAQSPVYAADEIRAALAWTRRAADRELAFAETLVLRMPAVFTALETGRIDRGKAWVFVELCADLTLEQAELVCARLLPRADALTTGELAARIKKLALALDPEWAARRYATAVRDLPEPQPRPREPEYPPFIAPDDDTPILERPPPPPDPPPPPTPPDPDEPPPF